jgi:hypothetical protein
VDNIVRNREDASEAFDFKAIFSDALKRGCAHHPWRKRPQVRKPLAVPENKNAPTCGAFSKTTVPSAFSLT